MKTEESFIWSKASTQNLVCKIGQIFVKLGFAKGIIYNNFYFKENENELLIIVIFNDDKIFGGNDEASDKFANEMKNEFEMSMIGEMKYFQGVKFNHGQK